MSTDDREYLVQSDIETPTIDEDVYRLVLHGVAESGIKQIDDSRLKVLAERLEFIESLEILMSEIKTQHNNQTQRIQGHGNNSVKITQQFNCCWLNHDFSGCHKDIESLIIYLLISCIDTIMGQQNFKDPFDWLLKEKGSLPKNEKDVKNFQEEYREKYGLARRFRSAFIEHLDPDLQDQWIEAVVCASINGPTGISSSSVDSVSLDAWEKSNKDNKMKSIANTLYSMRSEFTHASIRSFLCDTPVHMVSSKRNKSLIAIGHVDLIELLKSTIRSLATNLIWNVGK